MRVFHGSDTFIERIDLAKGAEYLDFGQGFYVTAIRKHAHKRSIVKALESGKSPVVTMFDYSEAHPRNVKLSVKRFHEVSEEWVHFVIMNRDTQIEHPTHSFDIVEGPIANDWITFQIKRYQKGKITVQQLLKELRYREQTHQICFCTPESLWALAVVEDDTHFDREDMHSLMIETLMNEFDLEETEAAHRLYRSAVFTRLSDTETKLYEKHWTEIYGMLKKELQM